VTEQNWRIGQLASSSGLSLRTLRYWDSLELVRPSARTEGGHRLYAPHDVERLYRVLALRSLGLSLESIATCLDGDVDLDQIVGDQLARAERQLAELTLLRDRLAHVQDSLAEQHTVTAEILLSAVHALQTVDDDVVRRHLDPDEIAALTDAARSAGPAARYQLEVEWPQLYRRLQALRADGVPATDNAVQHLVGRLDQLERRFSGGDPEVSRRVRAAWSDAPDALSGHPDPPVEQWAALADYLDRARAAAADDPTSPSGHGEQ
jgi:DNA-binding transcriptional MerR regulator